MWFLVIRSQKQHEVTSCEQGDTEIHTKLTIPELLKSFGCWGACGV